MTDKGEREKRERENMYGDGASTIELCYSGRCGRMTTQNNVSTSILSTIEMFS